MNEHDATIEDIQKLIMEAENPRDKAELLILLRISQNLAQNTQLTEKLSTQIDQHVANFAKHEKDEMALINQGRGFLRAMVIGLAVFQALMVWMFNQHLDETKTIQSSITSLQLFQADHQAHHREERETYKAWMNK